MIAAVTNFYNPAGRKVKWDNFIRFREALKGIPLYIVEAAFGSDPFVLPEDDCTLQVRCRDLIWQQYRLVNAVIRKLPDHFDKVVWIDADILFPDDQWVGPLSDMLDQFKVVQSYGEIVMRGQNEVKRSVTKQALENAKNPLNLNMHNCLDMASRFATGFSWAVQREVIEKYGIYDYWITGSSDNAFVIGIWGDWSNPFLFERLNEPMRKHFMEWAVPFNAYIGGSVNYLDIRIDHLWHGYRNYKKRWRCLKDFDPAVDIKISDEGVFEWCSDKSDMHRCCEHMCLNYDLDFHIHL